MLKVIKDLLMVVLCYFQKPKCNCCIKYCMCVCVA